MIMYREDATCLVDKSQVGAMKISGWSMDKPEKVDTDKEAAEQAAAEQAAAEQAAAEKVAAEQAAADAVEKTKKTVKRIVKKD